MHYDYLTATNTAIHIPGDAGAHTAACIAEQVKTHVRRMNSISTGASVNGEAQGSEKTE